MDSDMEVTADEISLEENLPAGMKFVPTDSEIIGYLKSYNWDEPALPTYIHQVDLSQHHPRDLMRIYGMQRSSECLIISRRNKKYSGGNRPCRNAGDGFYKPTSKDSVIVDEDGEPAGGVFKTLAYYEGKCRSSAKKSNWMIKEYRLGHAGEKGRYKDSHSDSVTLDGFVLCKLYESTRRKRKGAHDDGEVEEGGAIEEYADDEEQLNDHGVLDDQSDMHVPYCSGSTDHAFQSHETDWPSREYVNHSGSFDQGSNPKTTTTTTTTTQFSAWAEFGGSNPKPNDNLWRPNLICVQNKASPFQYGSKIHGVGNHHDHNSLVPLDIRPMNIVPGCQSQSSVDLDPMFGIQGSMTSLMQQQQGPYLGNVNSFAVNEEGGVLDSERSYCQANLLGMAFNQHSESYIDGHSHMNTNKSENSDGIKVHGHSSNDLPREAYFEDNQREN